MTDLSRRQFIGMAGAGAASVWLTASISDLVAAGRHAATAQRFEVLSAADAADVEAFASQIIPTDDTPGAREARVVHFIDRALATFAKDQRPALDKGLKELRVRVAKAQRGTTSFAALPNDKQVAIVAGLEKDKHPFFFFMRYATITGMLAMPEYGGNYNKLGWKWIGFDDQFSWAAPFGWYDRDV
jgi:gluconate 2-dehydrogenase gamma chain